MVAGDKAGRVRRSAESAVLSPVDRFGRVRSEVVDVFAYVADSVDQCVFGAPEMAEP